MEEVNANLTSLHKNYYNFEWSWVADTMETFYDKKLEDFTPDDVITIVEKWKESVLGIDRYLYEDAKKEFSLTKMTGFGIDGLQGARELDFAQVRGEFDENDTVKTIREHMKAKSELGEAMIGQMKKVLNKKTFFV